MYQYAAELNWPLEATDPKLALLVVTVVTPVMTIARSEANSIYTSSSSDDECDDTGCTLVKKCKVGLQLILVQYQKSYVPVGMPSFV